MHKSLLEIKTILPTKVAEDVNLTAISNRDETDSSRKLAPNDVNHLKPTGLFRMGLPKFLGG